MSQLRLDLSEPFTNRELFKNHFLTQRLTALPAWQDVAEAAPVFVQIRTLYLERARHFTATTNEAQTEDGFIKPVLDLLWGADCRQVQVSIPNLDGRRQPDYALFRGAAERDAAEAHKGTPAYWAPVACVGDAKRWNVSLDQKREGETPSAQITNYLYRTRVRWGLLTNGRLWRLYEQERSRGGGVYFEVDLGDLLERGDADAFRWFWLFFRREAHLPDQSGRSFLETVLEGSEAYAAEVGDRLKDSVYDALRRLMNGLFDEPANHLDRHDPAAVARVHEHALILLYRLLFVLYAEDRDLLPRDNEHYQSISLCARHREINRALREGAGRAYQMPRYRLWQDLCDLFRVIDQGFAAAGIPAYNGGLFNPAKHPHLADRAEFPQAWRMADGPLAEAIDLLAYERPGWDQPGSKDIDYATLDVRHLGSIYEGLLELRPVVAAEALVEQLVEGKPKWVWAAEVAAPRPLRGQRPREVAAGELYLATDGGERKATGSFYTPAFIVDYIVEQTVGPLADAAAGQVAALRPQVEARVKELEQQQTALAARGLRSDEVRLAELERQAASCRESLLEPYLSLAILDPAMGSGHFLVGAADHLSLAMATDPNLPDPPEGVEAQAWYKRRVVERCLYGVDLNGLAVELAKLSLWLHTVSDDRALSFLDHHLRAGNSLIGARLERDLTTEPPTADSRGRIKLDSSGQMVLGFTATLRAHHLSYLLDTFAKIAGATAGDAAGERAKAAWYAEMDAVRERFRQVANLWLAPFGGAAVTAEQFEQAVE
ncbi:MAG: N-6 DNA methylase, partial [Armatimonadetes bacterium]|nr:N-6 DNA methylase [Armatimonadota bacterium]